MKRIVLSVLALLMTCVVMARELGPDEALSRVLAVMQSGKNMRNCRAAKTRMNGVQLRTTLSDNAQHKLVYVYNLPQGGFMLASGDTRANAILGYAEDADYDAMQKNPAFMSWMKQCREVLAWLAQQPETEVAESTEVKLTSSVAPLLDDIKWNQGAPYNNLCPIRKNSEGKIGHAATGCVATAMAQVMCYHQWPNVGMGQHTNRYDSTQVVDFTKSVYDWSLIKHQYAANETGAAADAVARLMYDAGCALDMQYGYGASYSYAPLVVSALTQHFGYNKAMTLECRDLYTSEEWNELLRSELDARRPLIFSAAASDGNGHEFVIDGYDTNGLFHVNWGWGGSSNNYFDINYLQPGYQGIGGGTAGYTIAQDAIVGVEKDENGSTVQATNLVVISPLQYSQKDDEISFVFRNIGGTPYGGYVGFGLFDESDNFVDYSLTDLSEEPLLTNEYKVMQLKASTFKEVKSGYTIRALYAEGQADEVKFIRTPISAPECLMYYVEGGKGNWGVPNSQPFPYINLLDCKLLSNTCMVAPVFSLTVECDKASAVEYNKTMKVSICKDEKIICYGKKNVFLQPGESTTVEVECCLSYDGINDYWDLAPGEYSYYIFYDRAEVSYRLTAAIPFEMVPLNVTYSNFVLNNTTFYPGDPITFTFDAYNGGSTHKRDFYLGIAHEGELYTFDGTTLNTLELIGGATTPVSISYSKELEPGNYMVAVYNQVTDERLTSTYHIQVKSKETSITQTGAATRKGQRYDINGRLKPGNHRGLYIIDGRKVVGNER